MDKIRCPHCREKLNKVNNEYVCLNNHHFDIAKSGYVNLLLNHPHSGDNKDMVNARKTILNAGYFKPLLEYIITLLRQYKIDSVLDLGCGEGYYSREIFHRLDLLVYGVDISKVAINSASKQCKGVNYLVGNIFSLPFDDESFGAVINIFAPHSQEIARVVKEVYIKVVPNPMHLFELKQALYENTLIKDEVELTLPGLRLNWEDNITYKVEVSEINQLLMMTPYFYKSNLENVSLSKMNVTMDFKIMVYHKS